MSARRAQRARTIGSVLRSIASVVVLVTAAIMVLAEFGVALGPILASAGIVGIAIGFGAQNLVRDFLSGMFMLLEDQYGVGDVVDLGEASGTVEAVGLRITTVRDLAGTVWYVRNGEILRVGNKSQGYAVAVIDLPLAHSADVDEVTEIVTRVATERVAEADLADDVLEPPEVLGVERVGPEGFTFRVTVRTNRVNSGPCSEHSTRPSPTRSTTPACPDPSCSPAPRTRPRPWDDRTVTNPQDFYAEVGGAPCSARSWLASTSRCARTRSCVRSTRGGPRAGRGAAADVPRAVLGRPADLLRPARPPAAADAARAVPDRPDRA